MIIKRETITGTNGTRWECVVECDECLDCITIGGSLGSTEYLTVEKIEGYLRDEGWQTSRGRQLCTPRG